MSLVTVPVGCSIYSKTINKFGMILEVIQSKDYKYPDIVVQYEGEDSYMTDIFDYEECVVDGRVIVFDKELTEQEKFAARIKHG